MKEMSKRESSKHMFRLGFYMHSRYMQEQINDISKELDNMTEEDIQNLSKNFKKEKEKDKDE